MSSSFEIPIGEGIPVISQSSKTPIIEFCFGISIVIVPLLSETSKHALLFRINVSGEEILLGPKLW